MKFYIFGTCSGTEPYPGRHHVSFAAERAQGLYWFDAGECCSYTAHNMGVDVRRTRRICISHTHMDHVGGLGSLFWTIQKLDGRSRDMTGRDIYVHIPELRSWEGIYDTLKYTEGGFNCVFNIKAEEYGDGLLFDDGDIKVTALHNTHLHRKENEPWRSFGFLIEGDGKRIVYSGDTGGIDEFAPLMENCDALFMETGHHNPVSFARDLISRGLQPKKLFFIHHGRDLLDRYEQNVSELYSLMDERVCVLDDATILEI